MARDHALGLAIWVATVGITSAALALLDAAAEDPARALEVGVLVTASVAATLTRYAALRFLVFARRGHAGPSQESPSVAEVRA
jgi:hypothetical protein